MFSHILLPNESQVSSTQFKTDCTVYASRVQSPEGEGVALRECESAVWYKHPAIMPTAGAVTIWACFQCNRFFCVIHAHSK